MRVRVEEEFDAHHPGEVHLDGRGTRAVGRGQGPRAHPHAALRFRRIRGHPCIRDQAGAGGVPAHRPHRAPLPVVEDPPDRCPVPPPGTRGRGQGDHPGQRAHELLHPPARVPGLRRDGAQLAELPGQRLDRRLALGGLPRRGGLHPRRPDEGLLVAPVRPQRAATGRQGHRPVHQLEPGQGRGDQGRLRRGDHAEQGGLRRRCQRRERLHGP